MDRHTLVSGSFNEHSGGFHHDDFVSTSCSSRRSMRYRLQSAESALDLDRRRELWRKEFTGGSCSREIECLDLNTDPCGRPVCRRPCLMGWTNLAARDALFPLRHCPLMCLWSGESQRVSDGKTPHRYSMEGARKQDHEDKTRRNETLKPLLRLRKPILHIVQCPRSIQSLYRE